MIRKTQVSAKQLQAGDIIVRRDNPGYGFKYSYVDRFKVLGVSLDQRGVRIDCRFVMDGEGAWFWERLKPDEKLVVSRIQP